MRSSLSDGDGREARLCTLTLLLLTFCLAGCATRPVVIDPSADDDLKIVQGPRIAVVLSGGGSKAAPYALGVLQGLVENDALGQIEYVSSVSGGGYAALYLYSRAFDIKNGAMYAPDSLSDTFKDCLPRIYAGGPDSQSFRLTQVPGKQTCPRSTNNWIEGDPFRFQNHLRGFQNVLRDKFVYRATTQESSAVRGMMAKQLLASVATAIPHHFANSLFDWKIRMSPTGAQYDQGVNRAWALTSAPLSMGICPDGRACARTPIGSEDPADGMSFDQLRALIEDSRSPTCGTPGHAPCGLPDWYINATAANHPVRHYFSANPYTLEDVFSFSSWGYGSNALGRAPWGANPLQPALTVPQAVAASAAFFDIMPPNDWPPLTRIGAAAGEHLLNLSWGTTIRNYTAEPADYMRRRSFHNVLPFPLYLFHRNSYGKEGVRIRLSDGGRSENLGGYTALRLGATHLLVVDAAADPLAQLDDVCALRHQLRNPQYRERVTTGGRPPADRKMMDLQLDGLSWGGYQGDIPLSTWCDDAARSALLARPEMQSTNLIRSWPRPIVTGCVLAHEADGRPCSAYDKAGIVAQIYLLKPVITAAAMARYSLHQPQASKCLDHAPEDSKRAEATVWLSKCSELLQRVYADLADVLPPETVGFMLVNQKHNIFPQHSTVRMTAASSPTLFGAYRELARHTVGYLHIDRCAEHPVRVLEHSQASGYPRPPSTGACRHASEAVDNTTVEQGAPQ